MTRILSLLFIFPLLLCGCMEVIAPEQPEKVFSSPNDNFAPPESPHPFGYYRYPVPPYPFKAAVGWVNAIDRIGKGAPPCIVEVDWLKLHAVVNGFDTILSFETFDQDKFAFSWYGLYLRNPWFGGNDYHEQMPFRGGNSTLIIDCDQHPDRVYHFWDPARKWVPAGTTRVWYEARVRITGGAVVQIGIDYWLDLTIPPGGYDQNNTEAGASVWIGNSTTDWQIVSVGKPG